MGCSAAISVTCRVVWPKLPESLPDGPNKLPQVKVRWASTAIVTVEGTQGLRNFHGSVSMWIKTGVAELNVDHSSFMNHWHASDGPMPVPALPAWHSLLWVSSQFSYQPWLGIVFSESLLSSLINCDSELLVVFSIGTPYLSATTGQLSTTSESSFAFALLQLSFMMPPKPQGRKYRQNPSRDTLLRKA